MIGTWSWDAGFRGVASLVALRSGGEPLERPADQARYVHLGASDADRDLLLAEVLFEAQPQDLAFAGVEALKQHGERRAGFGAFEPAFVDADAVLDRCGVVAARVGVERLAALGVACDAELQDLLDGCACLGRQF